MRVMRASAQIKSYIDSCGASDRWHGILWRQIVRFHAANFRHGWLLYALRASTGPQSARTGFNQMFPVAIVAVCLTGALNAG